MIANEELGIRNLLSMIMNHVFGNMPFPLFVVILVAATLLCTNVFSNTATAVIIGTVVGPFLIKYATIHWNQPKLPHSSHCHVCIMRIPYHGGRRVGTTLPWFRLYER